MNAAAIQRPWSRVFRGWWIVGVGYLSQLGVVACTGWVFGVLILPMQDDLGWSRSEVVGVVTVARLIGGVVAVKLGPFVDSHGARGLMTLSAVVAAACLAGTALVESKLQYYALWSIFGLCIPGLSNIGPAVAISNWFVRRRAQAVMFYTLGSATAGLILVPIVTVVEGSAGWRVAWACMALLFLAVAPLAWTIVRHRPEDLGQRPDGAEAPPADSPGYSEAAADADELSWTVREALHTRAFWMLTLGFMLTSFPAASIFIHMSSFVQSKGFSSTEGAAAVTCYGLGVLAGRFFWGAVVTKVGVYKALVAYGFGYGLSILLFVAPRELALIYATTILLGISIAGAQQLHVQAFPEYFGRRIVGSLLAYAGVGAAVVGSTAPLLAAVAFDSSGSYSLTFTLWGFLCLLAGILFVFSRPAAVKRDLETSAT